MPLTQQQIRIIVAIAAQYLTDPQSFRATWHRQQSPMNASQFGMAQNAQFRAMTRFDFNVFMDIFVAPMRRLLNRPNNQIQRFLRGQNGQFGPDLYNRAKGLSIENRIMRLFMYGAGHKVNDLERTFAQKKSTIYADSDFLVYVFAHILAHHFELPLAGSAYYNAMRGSGVMNGIFPSGVYIMDGHRYRIRKPSINQSMFYSGLKHYHNKNYLFLHRPDGVAVYIHGGEYGKENDITLLRRSSLYQNLDILMNDGDIIICDGAWDDEGMPFICGFTRRDGLTPFEAAFNYEHAEVRVICENFYGRKHTLFPIFNYWTKNLDKLDYWVRFFSFATNVHILHQAPLRDI